MKYHILLLTFLLFGAFPGLLCAQENPVAPAKHQQRLTGHAKLSNGIFLADIPETEPARILTDFLEEESIKINTGTTRKTIALEMRQHPSIRHIPAGVHHGYSIRVTPQHIIIEYQTLQGAAMAVRQFIDFYRQQTGPNGTVQKKIQLPCCEIRSWLTDTEMSAFRWTGPQTTVPLGATCVEMMLTDPVKGWYGATDVLSSVGYDTPLYTGGYSTYADAETERKKLARYGLEIIPVFDLSGSNEPFERVTGHPMLSVEGMRFIQALVGNFLEHTESAVIAFILPEGRYREQIRQFIGLYPQITDLRFLE